METDPLKAARLELAPELVQPPPDPGSALVGRAGTDLTEEALDVAMYERLQRAKQPSTAAGFSRNGITMTAEQIAGVSLSQEKDALRAYRDRRLARGEEPFQYLAKAKAKQDNAAFREQLPFFGTLFAGPEKFTEAFPPDQRQAVEDRFTGSMQPAREKMATANRLFYETMTGEPVIDKLWPAQRAAFARQRLGYEGASRMVGGGDPSIQTAGVDDATFYKLAGSKVAEQQTEMETARKVAEITRFHAVRGKPLGEAITAAKAAAGPDWKKYEGAAREGYANVLVDFDDRTIKSGNKLFEFAKKAEGGLVTDLKFEDGQAAAMAAYGMADQDTRDKMMAIIGTRAVEEGTTVENYFASLAAGVGGGTNSFARQLASGTTRREAEEIRQLLKGGRMPNSMEGLTSATEIRESLSVSEQAFDRTAAKVAGDGPYRSMTAEERKEWEARATMLEGYAAFLTDTETAGIKVRKYLDNKREGFWDTLADTTVMMAESLPVMAAAMVPYGGGVLLAGSGYAEKNLSTLRREAPDADPETLKRIAFTSGMIEAGIDRLQVLTLGAKMPKVNAALLKYGKPGLVGVIAVQAATKGTAEFGQEIAQDLTLPQIQEFASALTEDIPGPDWKAVLQREYEALGDIARVSFGFGIIGGAGSSIVNYIDAGKVRETLQDREGLALAGHTAETIEAVATLAETNPAAAAETLKAAVIETPAETRKANSAAAKAKLEADPPPTAEEAAIPSIEKDEAGGFIVRYPDGQVDQARSESDALEAVRAWEMDDLNRMDVANRELARELEATHSANPELGVSTKFTGRQVTMQDWAGGNAAKIEQARQRVRIALRQEFQAGERKDDGSSIPDAELPLDAYLILGSSKNFGGAVTRISMEIHKRGNVATVLEEHAEGVAKWVLESGKYSRADMIRGIRETEAATGKQTLPDDLDSMAPEAATQAIVEAFSRLAVANAFGKVQESSLSAKFKALFRALKEAFTAILSLAGEIRALQLAGQMDAQFAYWLDVAGGVSEQYQQENLQREAEKEMLADAFDGIPEVQATIKGRLPHPDTPGILFPGEIRAIYEGIANNPESGASKAARTKTANAFFLPVGEKADLDEVREFLNEKGFGFDTPADMLEAVDLSVNYGKPQYGIGAGMDQGFEMETFSIGSLDATVADYTVRDTPTTVSFSIGPADVAHNQALRRPRSLSQRLADEYARPSDDPILYRPGRFYRVIDDRALADFRSIGYLRPNPSPRGMNSDPYQRLYASQGGPAGRYPGRYLVEIDPTRAGSWIANNDTSGYHSAEIGTVRMDSAVRIYDRQAGTVIHDNIQDEAFIEAAGEPESSAAFSQGFEMETFSIGDYRIEHQPHPDNAQLSNLTEMFPDDIYGPNAIRYYGVGQEGEKEAVAIFRRVRDKPDAPVTIYRVVPDFVENINPGDWVTISKAAAEAMNTPDFIMVDKQGKPQQPKIITKDVKAGDVRWPGDSLLEQGYFPQGDVSFSIAASRESLPSRTAISPAHQNIAETIQANDAGGYATQVATDPLEGGKVRTIAKLFHRMMKAGDRIDFSRHWKGSKKNFEPGQEKKFRGDISRAAGRVLQVLRLANAIYPNFQSWYETRIKMALDIFQEMDPDAAKPENNFVLRVLLAVTSNGNTVKEQTGDTWKVYQSWKTTGKMGGVKVRGTRATEIGKALGRMDILIGNHGWQKMDAFLGRTGTVKELRQVLVDEFGFTASEAEKLTNGELIDEQVPFALIFGAKLGSFYNNLSGNFDTTTMDRWFMRTFARAMGMQLLTVDKADIQEKRDRLAAALAAARANPAAVMILKAAGVRANAPANQKTTVALADYFEKAANREGLDPVSDELRLASNALFKIEDGFQLVEAPQNGAHRRFIRLAMAEAKDIFSKESGKEWNAAELQALLWYFEKSVHDLYGSKQRDESPDYGSAANELFRGLYGQDARAFEPSDAVRRGKLTGSGMGILGGTANGTEGQGVAPSFSAVRADSPLLKAIDALAAAPEAKAKVFAKMRDKVSEVRDRMNATRRTAGFSEEDLDPDRFEKLRDLATLEAIAKALPAAIRGRLVGEFRPLEELKTTKGREAYLVKLLPSIERALEGHLQDQFRQAIRREMLRGAVKVAEAKTRGGKIGALGHEIFDMAKAAMTMDPETAAAEADKIQAKIEGGDSLTMDQLEELDAKLAAVELFADYQAADSRRLELALELLKDSYRAGRAAWLETLMERRMLRDQRVLTFQRGLGLTFMDPDGIERPLRITDAMRNAAKRADEKLGTRFLEGLMSAILSGSQKIRRMAELSTDPLVKRAVEDMEDAFAGAEALETDLNLADNAALSAAMRKILGVSTEYGLAKKLRELSEAKGAAPVEKIEGLKKEKITVPINIIESLLAGEVAGFTTDAGVAVELDAHDLEALQEEWDRFQDLQEEDQGRKRVLNFTRLVASGKRITIGEVSQLEGLQLYLTMRQPDQARKLERLGYDTETMQQLFYWLKPEVKALGAWMVDFLKSEQDAVDALHRQEKGVALRLVDNYFPVRNDVSGSDSGGLSLDGGGAQQTGRSVGFIKERVANNAPPAYVNALAVFLAHRAQSNFWKSHVTPMREWGGIVRDERFSGAVKTKLGNTYYQSLSRLMERIEAGGVLGARQVLGFERWVKGLMRGFSLGTLGLRMSTLMVNTTAVMNAGLEIPARDLVKGMMLAAKRPDAFKDAWNSPVIQRRLKDGSSIEAKLAKSSGPSTKPTLAVLQSLAEKGVAPINVVDTAANLLGAASVWEYTRTAAVRAGLPDAAARLEADTAVERLFRRAAQPSSRFARSEIEMRALDNPISALMSLFISEPRKNAAIAFLAGRELLTGKGTYGKSLAAQQLVVGLVVMVAAERIVRTFYEALAKAEDDDEDGIFARWWNKLTDGKAWAHAFATSHLRGVPLAGEAWNQVTASALDQKVFDSSPNPLNKIARVGVDAVKDMGEEKTAKDRLETGIDVFQAFGSALPGGAFFSQLANVADFAEGVATSNGVDFTDADRAARIKARYAKHGKELDELHGKTTGEDGKPRPEIRERKAAAKADWLRSALAPLPAAEHDKVLDAVKPSKEVRDMLAN
jgi:hypothetical protein